MPDSIGGGRISYLTLKAHFNSYSAASVLNKLGIKGAPTIKQLRDVGCVFEQGFMLRYIYFIDKTALEHLTVPILPFSDIERAGACMYKGERL